MAQSIFTKSLIGANGGVSSKRIILYWLIALFSAAIILNVGWNKSLDTTLKEYLFYLIIAFAGFNIGDNVIKANKDIKIARKDTPDINVTNNKADELTQVNVDNQKPNT